MRVIAGIYKGRRLKFPKTVDVRPTKDRIRESCFEIIKASLPEADVLDLFAGSGSLGMEALSRGAASVTFVERDEECVKTIEENLGGLGAKRDSSPRSPLGEAEGFAGLRMTGDAVVIRSDAFRAIKDFSATGTKFGIVIADPPYNAGCIRKLLIKLDTYDILKGPFLIIIEHSEKEHIPQKEGNIILLKQYKYGDIFLSVYRKKTA